MKKIVSFMLVIAILFSGLLTLTGCGNGKEEKKEKPYAEMTAEELVAAKIKDKENITADEMVELISTYKNVKIKDDYTLESNITDEALKSLDSKAKPKLDTYLERLLKDEAAQVRGYGISLITSLTGVSKNNLELAKELIKNETDEYVLYKTTRALSNEAKSGPEIAEFLIKMSKSENPLLRKEAAIALGNSWSEGVDGAVDAIITLMSDENKDVKKMACQESGKLHDEKVIEPLVKILNNPDEADFHGDCVKGLAHLWYDYPFFKQTSEKAYKATLDYLKTTPRTEKVPAWTAVGEFKTTSTQDSFKEWKQKATYFNTDELYNVMVDIIKDPAANYLARTAAIDEIKAHCSEEKFNGLQSIIDGLSDSKANSVKSAYNSKKK